MKKLLFIIAIFIFSVNMYSQKYALIDMQYILKNIPEYNKAMEQLNQNSAKLNNNIEQEVKKVTVLYKKYQKDKESLNSKQKTEREKEIVSLESNIKTLKEKYFGKDNEFTKTQESIIKPIQENIYKVVKQISIENNIDLVIDRSTASSVIFASPQIDISNDVISLLGY